MFALAQARPAKIKAQHRITKVVQRLHGVKDDFVVQSSAVKGMRMAYQRSVSGMFRTRIEQGFQPTRWAVEEQRADRTGLNIHSWCILKHSSPEYIARAKTLQATSLQWNCRDVACYVSARLS